MPTKVNNTISNRIEDNATCKNGWTYNMIYGSTAVTQFDLVCESAWKRPIIQAIFMTGTLLGSLFGGLISDRFGRKLTLAVSLVLTACGYLVLSFSQSYISFLVTTLYAGVVFCIGYLTTNVYGPELVSVKHTSVAILYLLLGWGSGISILPLIAYLAKDWVWLPRTTVVFSVFVSMLVWLFLPESPHWLSQNKFRTKQKQKCQKTEEEKLKDETEVVLVNQNYNTLTSPYLLIKNPVFRKRIIIVCILWNVGYLGYFTTTLNSSNLGGDIYINCLISGVAEILTAVLVSLIWKLKRRTCSFVSLIIAGLACIATPAFRNYHVTAGVVSAMIGKLCIAVFSNITVYYTMELFPTLLRNTSVGIASMFARIATIVSPFLIFAGESVDNSIPFYVMGGSFFLCCFLVTLLPETSNIPLPDSNQDALDLESRRTSYWDLTRKRNKTTKRVLPSQI